MGTGVGRVAGMGLVVPIAEEVVPQINGIGVVGCACLCLLREGIRCVHWE